MERSRLCFYILLGAIVCSWAGALPLWAAETSVPAKPDPEIMRRALHHALNLEFEAALSDVNRLKDNDQPTLGSRLLRGMIAYLQVRWQSRQSPPAGTEGHKALTAILESAETYLSASDTASSESVAWLQTALGLAAVFDALLQQSAAPWQSMQQLIQGRAWLEQARIEATDSTEAHLGLGLAALVASQMPGPLRLMWRQTAGSGPISQAKHHLKQAVKTSSFGRDLARTFLGRLYEREHQYDDAIELGQALQTTFPDNGYYGLLIGRSQCANSQYAACAETLGRLVDRLKSAPDQLVQRDDRFDLYYSWGTALNETERYDQAFTAFRQAISQDPGAANDNTLWANFHLARLYERRGKRKIARQLYRTILRRRNVDDLHDQTRQRLATLR